MKYDDYEYYFLNFENENLPQEAGATHIGMFMTWAILNGLAARRDDSEYTTWLERVWKKEITGRDFLLEWCDGKLCSEDLNEAGNAFAKDFYEEYYMGYYCKVFKLEEAETADELCGVEDTWQNFYKLKFVLETRYKNFIENRQTQHLAVSESEALEIINNMEFVEIPAGQFMMGKNNDYPVTIGQNFYLGKYLVTQAQWLAIMDNNPSHFRGNNLPVDSVSWLDVQEFIKRLNAKTGLIYCLPTEAQWEYACRAGTTTSFYSGDALTHQHGNFSLCGTTAVGTYLPNPWGLYDMAGNLREWTDSVYTADYTGVEQKRMSAEDISLFREKHRVLWVMRGGSWVDGCGEYSSSTYRYMSDDYMTCDRDGFRLAREI